LKSMIKGVLLLFPVVNDALYLAGPASGTKFMFSEQPGSPNISSFSLPILPGVQSYSVSYEIGNTWSNAQMISPGMWSSVSPGTDGLRFAPLDASGNPVRIDSPFYVEMTFGQSGTLTATLTALSQSSNDFTGDGMSDMLLQNADGATQMWLMNGISTAS